MRTTLLTLLICTPVLATAQPAAPSPDALRVKQGLCTASSPLSDNTPQRWNGWGPDVTNTRFQPAAAGGITAADVPRLRLKWAYGLPNEQHAARTVADQARDRWREQQVMTDLLAQPAHVLRHRHGVDHRRRRHFEAQPNPPVRGASPSRCLTRERRAAQPTARARATAPSCVYWRKGTHCGFRPQL